MEPREHRRTCNPDILTKCIGQPVEIYPIEQAQWHLQVFHQGNVRIGAVSVLREKVSATDGTGVGIGALVGLIIGFVLPNTTAVGRGVVAMLVAAGFAIIGGLVASALVVGLDGTRKAPEASGFPWDQDEAP